MSEDAPHGGELTRLLEHAAAGEQGAMDRLFPFVYDELRKLASGYLRRERPDHTLQPTALANEAYLRLIDQRVGSWKNRAHFFGIAAQAMRRILVDHARARQAAKRGGPQARIPLTEIEDWSGASSIDLVALDDAMQDLAKHDARKARVVELRFYGGLTVDETAEALQVSPVTVARDWTMARAFLLRELSGQSPPPELPHG